MATITINHFAPSECFISFCNEYGEDILKSTLRVVCTALALIAILGGIAATCLLLPSFGYAAIAFVGGGLLGGLFIFFLPQMILRGIEIEDWDVSDMVENPRKELPTSSTDSEESDPEVGSSRNKITVKEEKD